MREKLEKEQNGYYEEEEAPGGPGMASFFQESARRLSAERSLLEPCARRLPIGVRGRGGEDEVSGGEELLDLMFQVGCEG